MTIDINIDTHGDADVDVTARGDFRGRTGDAAETNPRHDQVLAEVAVVAGRRQGWIRVAGWIFLKHFPSVILREPIVALGVEAG